MFELNACFADLVTRFEREFGPAEIELQGLLRMTAREREERGDFDVQLALIRDRVNRLKADLDEIKRQQSKLNESRLRVTANSVVVLEDKNGIVVCGICDLKTPRFENFDSCKAFLVTSRAPVARNLIGSRVGQEVLVPENGMWRTMSIVEIH